MYVINVFHILMQQIGNILHICTYIGNGLYSKSFCISSFIWRYFVCYILLVEVGFIKSIDLEKHVMVNKKKNHCWERQLIQKMRKEKREFLGPWERGLGRQVRSVWGEDVIKIPRSWSWMHIRGKRENSNLQAYRHIWPILFFYHWYVCEWYK